MNTTFAERSRWINSITTKHAMSPCPHVLQFARYTRYRYFSRIYMKPPLRIACPICCKYFEQVD